MKKILIIEDDHDLRLTLRNLLKMNGYEVLDVADGEAGAVIYQSTSVDLVLTDIFMPEKEGIEVIVELHRNHPNVRIIAMSGGGIGGDLDYLHDTEELGADRIFEKPVDMDELLNAISDLLE